MEKLIPYIIGVTPRFYEYRKRGNEIKYWMDMLSTDYNMCKLDWVDEEHILSNLVIF